MNPNLHPFIRQLFAEGYTVGSRVVGRCLEVVPDNVENGTNLDWWATLTPDNLKLTECRWHAKGFDPNGTRHPDGLKWLKTKNDAHFGIYYNINGGRKNVEVKRFYTIAWEDDKTDFATQQRKSDEFGLVPTTVVRTRRSLHTKYRIVDEDCVKENWVAVQEEMSLTMASDPTIKDLPRLMRCAGFNHVKWAGDGYELTPCVLEVCEPERIYTLAQVKAAMAAFAPQPFSQLRYRAYNFAIGKLNQRKSGIPYPLINPEDFRTCPDNELEEKLCRLRLYARLCELEHKGKGDGTDPALAWTQPLKKVRNRYKSEVEVQTVNASPEQLEALEDPNENLVLRWARQYGEGWTRARSGGRHDWDTCRCPVHGSGSNSFDNLHVNRSDPNYNVGSVSCKSGCDAKEIIRAFRQLAKDAGDETWNWTLTDKVNAKAENNIVPLRTPDELSAIEAIQKKLRSFTYPSDIEVNEQYFPLDLWRQFPQSGIVNIIGQKGCGKSEQLKRLIADFKAQNRLITLGTPRITLGQEQAAKWGTYYLNDLPVKYNPITAPSIGLCPDSLPKLRGRNFANSVVILDEAQLFFQHMLTSDTCKNDRPRILATFEYLITETLSNGGLVILADADLTDDSVDYVKAFAPVNTPVFTVKNNHKGKQWDVRFIEGARHPLDRWVINQINAGKRLVITSDSQTGIEKLHKIIQRDCPGKNTRRFDGETSQIEDSKAFLKKINAEIVNEDLHALLYTSSMGVGVSIDVEWFDEEVGFYVGVVEPSQFRQQLARPRAPIRRTVWTKHSNHLLKGDTSYLPAEIKQRIHHYTNGSISVTGLADELARLKAESATEDAETFHQRVMDEMMKIKPVNGAWQNPHHDLFAKVKARENYGITHAAEVLKQELIADGHNVSVFRLTPGGLVQIEADGKAVKAELPVEPSAEALRLLSEPIPETPELQDSQDVQVSHDDPNTSIYTGSPCDALTQRQRIEEAIAFDVSDEAKNRQTKEEMQKLTEEKNREKAHRLYEAQALPEDEAYNVRRNPLATEEEIYQAQKTFLEKELPGMALTPEYIEKAIVKDKRRWLSEVKNFWYLTNREKTHQKDRKTLKYHFEAFVHTGVMFLPDVRTHEPKFEVLRDIGLLRFATDPTKEFCATDADVLELFEAGLKCSRKLKTTWNLSVSRTRSNPIDLLRRLLEKVGLGLKLIRQVRVGGKPTRFYALDDALFNNPDRLATLASMDARYADEKTPESHDTPCVQLSHDAPTNSIYTGSPCDTSEPPPEDDTHSTVSVLAPPVVGAAQTPNLIGRRVRGMNSSYTFFRKTFTITRQEDDIYYFWDGKEENCLALSEIGTAWELVA
jgi:hypothetical protein